MKNYLTILVLISLFLISNTQAQIIANFSANSTIGCTVPHGVVFTDASTGPFRYYTWNFGDGSTSNLQNPVHTYTTPGTFLVRLIVQDSNTGTTDIAYDTIKISAPNADIGGPAAGYFGCAPLTANFNDNSSSTVGIASWSWTFGDGGTSALQNPAYIYQKPGSYSVSLMITDSLGCTNTDTKTNFAFSIGPDVNFGADETIVCNNSSIQFRDSTIFGSPSIGWTWNFGDGSPNINLQNPIHTYSQSGTYSVSLTVTDIDGCSRSFTETDFISVQKNKTRIVSNTNNTGPGSLRQTIADACPGDTIRFDNSLISSGSATIDLNSEIVFNKNLTIVGLYNSSDTLFVNGNNTSRIFNVDLATSIGKNLVLDSMVLIDGNAGTDYGGAINFIGGDSLNILNSGIYNSTSGRGGGIYSSSHINLTNSTINGNSSTGSIPQGGGIYAQSTLTITHSTISGNSSSGTSSADGGGIYSSSHVDIAHSTISGNSAFSSLFSDGGGIFAFSSLTITHSTISGNSSSGSSSILRSLGGGIYVRSVLTLSNSTISGNSTSAPTSWGGGIYALFNCIITNSTISGNSSFGSINSGGGLYTVNGFATITNSSIIGNSSSIDGSTRISVTRLTIGSSIVSNNGANNISLPIISQGYNLFSDAPTGYSTATDQINVTAAQLNLGPLQNNGGFTKSQVPQYPSIAINAGNPIDLTNAQNGQIVDNRREVGAAESCVTVNPNTIINVCSSYTWTSGNGVTYVRDTIVVYTRPISSGCIAVDSLHLTIRNKTFSTDIQVHCDSYTWTNGVTYTSSNNSALDTFTNAAGCDSIVTLNLTITNSNSSVDVQVQCDSYTWTNGVTYTSANNTALDTFTNAAGCDSIVTLNLTINRTTRNSISATACDSYTGASGRVWKTSGTYVDTVLNAVGCDSITSYSLVINYSTIDTLTITACNSYTGLSGQTWTVSGTYTDVVTNSFRCARTTVYILTINSTTSNRVTTSACNSYTGASGQVWTVSGTYSDTILNSKGCDSITTYNLTINSSNSSTDVQVACDSYTWINGVTYTQSTTATQLLTNVSGCDSIVTLNLTINRNTRVNRTISACDSYQVPETGNVYTASGVYLDSMPNASGCFDYFTTNLTINTVTAGRISLVGTALTITPTNGDFYRWLDCDKGFEPVAFGDSSLSFTPTRNGNYACMVYTSEGCIDTSACFNMNSVGIVTQTKQLDWNLYPNPARDNVTIKVTGTNETGNIKIYNATGKLVYEQQIGQEQSEILINVSNMASGIYTVMIQSGSINSTKRLIVN